MNFLQKEACRAIVNVFETGKVRGDYGAVTVIKGDNGHLSYGRSQVSLGSGHLYHLIDQYCQEPSAVFAGDLKPYLQRLKDKDVTLDGDDGLKTLLRRAGKEDTAMRTAQDQYFNQNFLGPALTDAEKFGVTLPLGQAVVYDSHVQGGWGTLSARSGKVGARGEKDWIGQYVTMRRDWLSSRNPPVPATVYRMDSFRALIQDGNFDLTLPFKVHGVMITQEALAGGEATAGNEEPRTLRLTSPYLRGDDVKALQSALAANGLPISGDGVYGPFTDALVKKWQKRKGITEDGAGPKTRESLGIKQMAKVAAGGTP